MSKQKTVYTINYFGEIIFIEEGEIFDRLVKTDKFICINGFTYPPKNGFLHIKIMITENVSIKFFPRFV